MKKIKLREEILEIFENSDLILTMIEKMMKRQMIRERKQWEYLQKQYSKLNFNGANIDYQKGILKLPFENYKDDGEIK